MPPTRSSQLLTRTLIRYGDNEVLPNIDVREKFVGPEVRIDVDNVERLCAVVGNQGESFKKLRTADVKAPMDFAITIMKSIFPSAIDGDFFKLVHLSNGFRMVEGARPLQVGDVCRAEARIVSVTNANEGKIVKVQGHVYRDGQPVITVVSTFLYRGRFVDFENTFEIFISNQLKRLVKVGSVDFQQDDSHGNSVLAYLQRHRAPQRLPTLSPTKAIPPHPRAFQRPSTHLSPTNPTRTYRATSTLFTSTRTSPTTPRFPATITHGLWSSAATRRYVKNVVAQGHPWRTT
ncbi:hypothetical protein HGRIS_001538 [Hohenbuehelia grisea]|uniref:Peroxisomal multifunctional enzyme type 2-like N-terminal domain-containing protein n=1 Tax=Hohenbuehelia grisea TaxID=104357 RepID=A0ABR3JRF6_9AGAR